IDADTATTLLRLIDMLEDCDDVQEVYHNGEISDEVAATL
ncbi:YebC/PmpR family DNA-binding transcriptional regulator, partial [Salmonella enterica]